MITDIETARDKLADAIWWLKGFAAARPASIDEGAGEHLRLESQLNDVRAFLTHINNASIRRMGEETAVILSFAEFERLVDAVRVPRQGEVMVARQVIEDVLAQYRAEDLAARRGDEIPF